MEKVFEKYIDSYDTKNYVEATHAAPRRATFPLKTDDFSHRRNARRAKRIARSRKINAEVSVKDREGWMTRTDRFPAKRRRNDKVADGVPRAQEGDARNRHESALPLVVV